MIARSLDDNGTDHSRVNRAVIGKRARRLERKRKISARHDDSGVPAVRIGCGRVRDRVGVGPGHGRAGRDRQIVGSVRAVRERFGAALNGHGRGRAARRGRR